MVKALILAAVITLAGCTTTGGFCSVAKPIRLSEQTIAAMSDAEVADALRHNELGSKACGWKP